MKSKAKFDRPTDTVTYRSRCPRQKVLSTLHSEAAIRELRTAVAIMRLEKMKIEGAKAGFFVEQGRQRKKSSNIAEQRNMSLGMRELATIE